MIDILYEDNHLFVVDKPPMLLTQPSGTSKENLETFAKELIKKREKKKGGVFLEAVHRLDKPVSGIVLFAKTSKALSRLTTAMRNRQVKKCYIAWVEGVVSSEQGILEHWMVHDGHRARLADQEDVGAKKGRLFYRVRERRKGQTLLDLQLETGRYHQIRVQLSGIGHPIVGDEKYGSCQPYFAPGCERGIALHHYRLEIPHPIRKEALTISSPKNFLGHV
ncbi:MAG: RNA pseudouridine synthase [Waddliaceae bacterium]